MISHPIKGRLLWFEFSLKQGKERFSECVDGSKDLETVAIFVVRR
jgi:hypothetical protein